MTLKLKLVVDAVRMYLHSEYEISNSGNSKVKVTALRDRHARTQTDLTEKIIFPHTQMVNMCNVPRYVLQFETFSDGGEDVLAFALIFKKQTH